jgi:hypothetical protein
MTVEPRSAKIKARPRDVGVGSVETARPPPASTVWIADPPSCFGCRAKRAPRQRIQGMTKPANLAVRIREPHCSAPSSSAAKKKHLFGNQNQELDLSSGEVMETKMRTLAIALATTTALAFGALAQSQQPGTSQTTPAAQGQTSNPASGSAPSAAPTAQSKPTATTGSDRVNVRANIRTGSNRTIVRERSRAPSAVYSRSRTRYVNTVDERPSRVTVIKKKKKYAKKKRTRVYATAPSSSTTIIERRRRGVVVDGGVNRSRVISRDSGVRARIGVSTTTRSTTGSSTRSSAPSGTSTGSGSAGSGAPSTTGATGATSPATAPAQTR